MSASSSQATRPLRVLSIPGRQHENRIFGLTLDALERQGVAVAEPRRANVALFRYDILLLNFPTHYITESDVIRAAALSAVLATYLLLARLLGRRIVYTVHDVVPFRIRHKHLLWPFLRLVHGLTQGFVFLSASSRQAFVARYPGDEHTPWIVVPHGPYPVTPIGPGERQRLRQQFGGDDAFILGLLGSIKPYKNVGALRGLPRRLVDGRALTLLVAGRAEAGHAAEVGDVLASMPPGQVVRIDERLSDDRLDALIQAVDAVLLPYVKGSNSGVAMLVLSNEGRLIGSDLPMFQELSRSIGPPWAYSVNVAPGSPGLAAAIEAAAARKVTEADRAGLRDMLRRAGHDEVAAELLRFYRSLDASRPGLGEVAGRKAG